MNILLLTGYSGVGKTTIGKILCELYGMKLISVRGLLHQEANNQGYERIRHWLANATDEIILANSRRLIISEIQKHTGSSGVVVDDNFDRELTSEIRECFPKSSVTVVCLTTQAWLREMHVARRMGVNMDQARQEMLFLDDFKRRAGIQEVIENADINLENRDTILGTVDTLHARLSNIERM